MSRTLHYGIEGSFIPNENQAFALYQLTHEYNTRFRWSVESIDLSKYRIYPDYDKLHIVFWSEAEKFLYERILELVKSGLSLCSAHDKLQEDGLITYRKKDNLKGFTKVSSNELNAHAVINFVIEASMLIPEEVFYLIDEGYALYCDLQIKNGLARPHYDNITEYLNKVDTDRNPGLKLKFDYLRQLLYTRPDYGDPSKYIRPLQDDGYLRERKDFQTKVLTGENIDQLGELMSQMASSEKEESAKYYEDINKYPQI